MDVQHFVVRTFPQEFPFAMSLLEGFVLFVLRYQITKPSMCIFAIRYRPFLQGFKYQEALGELEGFLDSQDYDSLAIVGDFSMDFGRSARQHLSDLIQFMDANDLLAKDLDFADIEFTYESDDGSVDRGWIVYLYLPMYCIEFTKYIYCVMVQIFRTIVHYVSSYIGFPLPHLFLHAALVCPLIVWHGIRLLMSKFILTNHW